MPNKYTDIYELGKTQSTILNSVMDGLIALKEDLVKQDYKKPPEQLKKVRSLIGFFEESPFDPGKTEHNLQLIQAVLDELSSLSLALEGDDLKLEDTNTRMAIVAILEKNFYQLTYTEKTSDFFAFVLNDITSYDFTTRQSSLIDSNANNNDADTLPWNFIDIEGLLTNKGLDSTIFLAPEMAGISFEHDIADHVAWAYPHIYQHAYAGSTMEEHGIGRFHHGMQHVTRAAMYARVFANLYRKHGDEEAASLTEEDIKLIQIAILFHDSARENDGEDHWDHESAILLYFYLRTMGVAPEQCKMIAEATANKDPSRNGYFELAENDDGFLFWRFNPAIESGAKNIFEKIIHDCDCLDIIRARNQFDSKYLDFYKEIAMHEGGELALEEMAHLVMEARSIIDTQGDLPFRIDATKKKRYEHEDAYAAIKEDISPDFHRIIDALSSQLFSVEELQAMQLVDLTSYDKDGTLNEQNIRAALREGQIWVRGIATPSASSKKNSSESATELELRKIMREIGVPTRIGRTDKKVNQFRSVSVLGYGASVYPSAGLVIINPELSAIKKISSYDFNTGRGKKRGWQFESTNSSEEETKREFKQLLDKMKIGGIGLPEKVASNYVEILYDLSKVQGVYYTPDPTIANAITTGEDHEPAHPHAPLLQAIYIQKSYEAQYKKIHADFVSALGEKEGEVQFLERFGSNPVLPVYEYSGLHNRILTVNPKLLTDEYIINLWLEMSSDFIKKSLEHPNESNIYSLSVNDIKILAMYGSLGNGLGQLNMAGDASYPEFLRERITQAIVTEKQRLIEAHEQQVLVAIKNNPELITSSNEILTDLVHSDNLRERCAEQIEISFNQYLSQVPDSNQLTSFYYLLRYSNSDKHTVNLENPDNELLKSSLYRIYLISQKLKLNSVTETIQQQVIEFADNKVTALKEQPYQTRPSDIKDLISDAVAILNMAKQFQCQEQIAPVHSIIDDLVIALSENFKLNMNSYNHIQLVFTKLNNNELLTEEHRVIFLELFNLAKENLQSYKAATQNGESDVIAHAQLACLLKQSFTDDLVNWMNVNPYFTNHFYHSLIEILKENSLEIDEPLFDSLVEATFHLIPIGSGWSRDLISTSEWIKQIKNTENIMPEKQFSNIQWELINKKYNDHAGRTIKEDIKDHMKYLNHYRASLSPEEKQAEIISIIENRITTILTFSTEDFKLEVPEALITEFNDQLNKLAELITPASAFKIDEDDFSKILKLHQKLPHPEARAEIIDKWINLQNGHTETSTNRNVMG